MSVRYAPPVGVPVLSPVIGGNPATGPNTGSPIIQVFHSTTPIQIPTAADGGLLSQPFLIPGPGRVIITGAPGGTGPLGSPLLWTWNGGASFGALNNDLPLIVGSVAALGVPVSTGDQINLASQEPALWDYLLMTYEPRTILAPPQWSGYVIQGLPGPAPWLVTPQITTVAGPTTLGAISAGGALATWTPAAAGTARILVALATASPLALTVTPASGPGVTATLNNGSSVAASVWTPVTVAVAAGATYTLTVGTAQPAGTGLLVQTATA
jgi:hypothetical protein